MWLGKEYLNKTVSFVQRIGILPIRHPLRFQFEISVPSDCQSWGVCHLRLMRVMKPLPASTETDGEELRAFKAAMARNGFGGEKRARRLMDP